MSEMTPTGRLDETPLAEVAGELFRRKKTGRLHLAFGGKEREVVFYEGSPVAVLSDSPEDHLGHFLTVKGKVSQEEGARIQELPETKEALQSISSLDKETLTWGLKYRFVNLAYDLFRWDEGTWSFEEGAPPRDVFLMKVPTPTLLSRGVRHMSPSLLMARIPGDHVIVSGPLPREEAAGLTEEERAFLDLCREGRRVGEIIEEETADPVRTRELLYILLALGIVATVPAGAAPPSGPSPPEGAGEAGQEPVLSLDEAAGAAEEPAEAFEIERHTYGDLAEDAGTGAAAEVTAAAEEPSPEGLVMPESLQPIGSEEQPEPPALEMPAPPEGEAAPSGMPGAAAFIDPDEGPAAAEEGDFEGPGLEMPPPPAADLPPPPWQEGTAVETVGFSESLVKETPPEAGQSPFAPPGEAPGARAPAPGTRPLSAAAPKARRGPSSRIFLLLAAMGGAAVVGAGIYLGSRSFRTPSSPLPPIPPAEEAQPEMAENLPVPALPAAGAKAPEKAEPRETAETPAPEPASEPVSEAPSPPEPAPPPPAAAASYESGLAAFESGDFQGAVSIWHDMAAAGEDSFSVSVVVACQIETVQNAFTSYGSERKIFTLPLKLRDGRSCYRVCMGMFDSRAAAQAAIDALPPMLQADLTVRTVKSIL